MGVTHSNTKTYPRLGDVIGFVKPEEGCAVAEAIMLTQRDNGNRADRKNAVRRPESEPNSVLDQPAEPCSPPSTASEVHR